MSKRKKPTENDLLDILLGSEELIKLQKEQPLSQPEINKLVEVFEQNYPGDLPAQTKAWQEVRPLLTLIFDWITNHAAANAVWRTRDNRLTETINIFARVVTNYNGSENTLVQNFEKLVVPQLFRRQDDLNRWMQELWDFEKVIRYAIRQTLKNQTYGYILDDSFIDLAFAEKIDDILLNYDPVRAGHASLKTYAVFLIYRQLLEKLRRAGFTDFNIARTEKAQQTAEEQDANWNTPDRHINEDIREAALQVCQATLTEVENRDENRLSKVCATLVYMDFLEQIISGSAPDSIEVKEALELLLAIFDSKTNTPIYLELKKLSLNTSLTLQALHNALLLEDKPSERVQLSQARRILANRRAIRLAVARFIDVAPYQNIYKSRLKHTPLKIIDYCFTSLHRFNDWKQVETNRARL